jgi:hypothetical protein
MRKKYIIPGIFLLLIIWVLFDLNYPIKTDLTQFNAAEVASLETGMWKAYYEKKKFRLFLLTAELMRKQFHVPFWRSQRMAWFAAKAAFVFKDGKNRAGYEKALPSLKKYYAQINAVSSKPFDVDRAAANELEWWIIRRDREIHPPAEWRKYLELEAEEIYHVPAEQFTTYSGLRVDAMLLRDSAGEKISAADWQKIGSLLGNAWASFSIQLQK